MVQVLKRLDKKFLIIVGCIICLPILLIIILAILQGCNRKISHEKYEEKMISALESYIKDKDKTPKLEGEVFSISLDKLVEKEYIKSTEKMLDDDSCEGTVAVRNNGVSADENGEGFLNYTVDLKCKEYSTVHLIDKLMDDLTTENSGLYQVGEEYIFKGDKVDNYIMLSQIPYRIIGIDKEGILKLVKIDPESPSKMWDNKFNVETNRYSGINIYKDSNILNALNSTYNNTKKVFKDVKKHLVAYDVCIGKRSNLDNTISKDIDCSLKLEKQIVSLLNVSDYALASLDPNCVTLRSRSCNNYNYLRNVVSSSWTLNSSSDNTYDVMYISDGLMEIQNAKYTEQYNLVVYIDGNELYTSGNGSAESPYLLN